MAISKNTTALRLMSEGNLAGALEEVNDAVRLAPRHASSYRNRAHIFEQYGLMSQAEADREFASRLAGPVAEAPPSVSVDTEPSWWTRGDLSRTPVAYAGFWIRLGASLIDGFILLLVQVVVALALRHPAVSLTAQLAVGIVYTIGFWVVEGATPGKMALGIKIIRSSGEPVGLGTAVIRYVGYFVSTITLLIGYLMIAFSPDKRGLHDLMADTVVIRSR